MADADVRALERRYRETGEVQDHARWIAARVRAGELGEHRARLAAELGHEAAGRALGVAPAPLERVLGDGLRDAAALSRQPAANYDTHWVLTGQVPDVNPSFEPAIDEDASRRALFEALRTLAIQAAPDLPPVFLQPQEDGAFRLQPADVLSCFPDAERPRFAPLVGEVRRWWALDAARADEYDPALDDEEARVTALLPFWPGFELAQELWLEVDRPALRLARALARTPRGLAHLAVTTRSPFRSPRLASLAAEVLGDRVVRDTLVAAVGRDLLRE